MESRISTMGSLKYNLKMLGYKVLKIELEPKEGTITIATDICLLQRDMEYIRDRTPLGLRIMFVVQEDKTELGISMEEMNRCAIEAMKSIFRNGKEE